MRLRGNSGFTMVELLITMAIFVLVIAAASNIFVGLIANFKQQSKLAESNIEGMVGLKMLKADVEQAGFGLPYDLNNAVYANEAEDDTKTAHNEQDFNNVPGIPNALIAGSGGYNGSDILVVKATSIGMNDAIQKWAYMTNIGGAIQLRSWKNLEGTDIVQENLQNGDKVIVIKPVSGTRERLLVNNAGVFYTTFPNWNNFSPENDTETYLIYGLADTNTTPRMPFNRADYYVRRPNTGMPSNCQGATAPSANSPGILYKAILNHADGRTIEYPLLDCVAAMKIVTVQDADGDATTIDDISYSFNGAWPTAATPAADIRKQLKEIRIYILAQEGQKDSGYQSPATMTIRDPDVGDLLTYTVPDRNYRWNIYTLIIKPYNLR